MGIEGWAGWLLLSVPWIALFVLALRARRVALDMPPARAVPRAPVHSPVPVSVEPAGLFEPRPVPVPEPVPAVPEPVSPPAAPRVEASAQQRVHVRPLPLLDQTAIQRTQLAEQLAGAVAASDERAIPKLHLALARLELASGSVREAGDHLRKCISLSAKLGMAAEHALARLELGDIAHRRGDMTTACEHWQIARSLFQDLGRAGERDGATKRMQSSGCPSDWVLNQF